MTKIFPPPPKKFDKRGCNSKAYKIIRNSCFSFMNEKGRFLLKTDISFSKHYTSIGQIVIFPI